MIQFNKVLSDLKHDYESISALSDYLGYEVGNDPINSESPWRILLTRKLSSDGTGVIAVKPQENLDNSTSTMGIRKLYQQVLDLKKEFGSSYSVPVVAFVGIKRVVFFKYINGNRDTRLDLNLETIDKSLYLDDLSYLKSDKIKIDDKDPFGLGEAGLSSINVEVSDKVFKKELTTHFLTVVSFYRKKLSELVTGSKLRYDLEPLISDEAKVYLKRGSGGINYLVQEKSFTSALSIVVDTIILRQLMRRFLEAYYGSRSFNVNDIALGVGSGTMDSAIKSAVNIAEHIGDEKEIKRLNRHHDAIGQLNLFDDLFSSDEQKNTSKIELRKDSKRVIKDLTDKSIIQFQLAYDGDLFAGSVSDVTTKVEKDMAKDFAEVVSKLWIDTSAGNYSFRYQDMPPEALEKQYESSMSEDIQIKIDKNTKKPLVYYGEDKQEQKTKGAYYTDERFVEYMISSTVDLEFDKRYQNLKLDLNKYNKKELDIDSLRKSVDYLLSLKIADFTAGGGSFLRGAFLHLANQFKLLKNINLPMELVKFYPMFSDDDNSQYLWEKYILENMVYGVDIDYKAIIISSLTLTLSSLEHRPSDTKLPQLIGRTLIHQNSLINSVPYYKRKDIFEKYKYQISKLIKYKKTDFKKFNALRQSLQDKVASYSGEISKDSKIMHIEAIELNLPELFFNSDGSIKKDGGVDVIIGNPPWDAWKPNSDEFFSEYDVRYRKLNRNDKKKFRKNLTNNYPYISKLWSENRNRIKLGSVYYRNEDNYRYQTWKINNSKTSSDINLYKISLERFTQLSKNTSVFSILVPDNLMTDNGSTGLRHLLFEHYNVNEFLSFINKKKIFKIVDSRYKFAVLSFNGCTRSTNTFKAFFYRYNLNDLDNNSVKLTYHLSKIREYEPDKLSVFEVKNKIEYDLYIKIREKYPILEKNKLIKLVNDFHKTNDSDKFKLYTGKPNEVLLYEGKLMNQFSILTPNEFRNLKPKVIPMCISKDEVMKRVGGDYKQYRVSLRAIASSTNVHSLISTILPRNVTFTHSLYGQKNAANMPLEKKLFIVGMFNSYVLDYVIRKLVTTNISKTYLHQLPMPKPSDFEDYMDIVQIVKELIMENKHYYKDFNEYLPGDKYSHFNRMELIAKLNARIMINFGLTRDEILTLMSTFKSSKHTTDVDKITQKIINFYDESNDLDR